MRSIKHWTPRYVCSRAREMMDHLVNPDHPWLTRQSIPLLSELIRPSDFVLEFGSGRSTRWFAKRACKVKSVEHDEGWYNKGLKLLEAEGIHNAELVLRPLDVPEDEGANAAYVRVLEQLDDGSVDICLVDGMYRGACALGAVPKLRSGGILILDNAGWYIPSKSRTPGALPLGGGARDAYCNKLIELSSTWRRIWTTSGVTDTLLMFKS
ncbi:MAG: hypothetical protein ACLPPF_08030 [Rhodomicrobium sp.]